MKVSSAIRARLLLTWVFVAFTTTFISPSYGASTPSAQSPVLLIRAGSSEVFYVVTSTGCNLPTCLRMYRTNDDATRYTRVSPPPVSREKGGEGGTTLDNVIFANSRDGYATVGSYSPSTLYVTTNGARTWRRVMHAKNLSISVEVTNEEIFVTSVTCKPRTFSCSQFTTRRASLAAKDWVTLPRLWKTGTSSKETYYGPSLAAYDKTVWELETGPETYLWISHNNGKTFTRKEEKFPALVSVSGCTITPMNLESLWAQCPTGLEESFWHSNNAGTTWTLASPARLQFSGTGGGSFAPVTSNVAVLDYGQYSTSPNLYRIEDGGEQFTPIGEVHCPSVSPLIFTNAFDGLMICHFASAPLVRRTVNGGATWEKVVLPRA